MMNNRNQATRTKYVALLRGISPMNATNNALKSVFISLGFEDVESVNSSGNIVFSTIEVDHFSIESAIEKALLDQLGLTSLCIVRSGIQIRGLVQIKPFQNMRHSLEHYLTLTFFKTTPRDAVLRDTRLNSTTYMATYLTDMRVFCAMFDNSLTKSPTFMSRLERDFGKDITTRTWETMLRIERKMFISEE